MLSRKGGGGGGVRERQLKKRWDWLHAKRMGGAKARLRRTLTILVVPNNGAYWGALRSKSTLLQWQRPNRCALLAEKGKVGECG